MLVKVWKQPTYGQNASFLFSSRSLSPDESPKIERVPLHFSHVDVEEIALLLSPPGKSPRQAYDRHFNRNVEVNLVG